MAPQIQALSEQHDVDHSAEVEEFKPADTDVQSDQHDVNQSDEAEEFKPADTD